MIKHIAIVWANPYNKNLGVAALAYSSLALLNDVMRERGIKGTLTFVGAYKSGKDRLVINGVEIEFDNIYGLDYLNWKSWVKSILSFKKYKVHKLLKFNYVFDIAEGDSFSDIYGDRRFFRILNSKRLFTFLKVKQVLLPQTIGPFSDPRRERSAISAMKKVNMVLSRDKKSYDYTAGFLPADMISELIDVAFYLPFERTVFPGNKIHVGINVSGLLWNGGYTGNNQFQLKTDYERAIRDILDYFTAREDIKVHIISHVIPEDSPKEDDYAVAEKLQEQYNNVVLSPRFKTPIEAKSYISGMDFFTGGRMHACIAAFSSGVPVVPMAYSRKFNGLFTDTLKYPWVADCVNEDISVVLDKLIRGFEHRVELREMIGLSEKEVIQPRLNELKGVLGNLLVS